MRAACARSSRLLVGIAALHRSLACEAVCLVACGVRLPAALDSRVPVVEVLAGDPGGDRTATPVVLVHGYLGTTAAWAPLAAHLRRQGLPLFAYGYDTLSGGVPAAAQDLAEAVDVVLAWTGQDRVHLVGHSLGGLLVRYAVQVLGLDSKVLTAVTVAAPHEGCSLAWLGAGPTAAQLRPGSPLLRALPPLDRTRSVRWVVIRAGADVVVPPLQHRVEDVVLADLGHNSVLVSRALADVIARELAPPVVPVASLPMTA